MNIHAKSLNVCLLGLAAGTGIALLAQMGVVSIGSPSAAGSSAQIALSDETGDAATVQAEQTSEEPGLLSRLAGAFTGPVAAPPIDYSQFKGGDMLKAFKERDFASLNNDEAQTLLYLSGFNDEISGQGVLFYTDNREILAVVDPALSPVIERRIFTSSKVMNQTTEAGFGALMGMMKGIADARRSGGSVGDELAAMNRGALNAGGSMAINQWKLEGQKDARVLASKFDSNREEFEQIYGGIIEYMGQ